jgi:hypothetical protein
MNLKAQLKNLLVPELSLILLFVLAGYCSGNIRLDPASDIPLLVFLVIGCYFVGSQLLKAFLGLPKSDLKLSHKVTALMAMVLVLIPPFVSYGQGWNGFLVTSLMFCFVVGTTITKSWVLKKIHKVPGLDIMLHTLTWGCLSMSVGVLMSGVEPETRSWLIVLLGFYIFASVFIMTEMNSSKSMKEKPSLIMFLGESRTLELIAILQLFGVIGLSTLYLSEYDSLHSINLTFYILFTLIALVSVFQTLVWSKDPSHKKKFNYNFLLISSNLYLMCWVVAEWFYQ